MKKYFRRVQHLVGWFGFGWSVAFPREENRRLLLDIPSLAFYPSISCLVYVVAEGGPNILVEAFFYLPMNDS